MWLARAYVATFDDIKDVIDHCYKFFGFSFSGGGENRSSQSEEAEVQPTVAKLLSWNRISNVNSCSTGQLSSLLKTIRLRTQRLRGPVVNKINPTVKTPRKVASLQQYFRDSKFSGDLTDSICHTTRDYNRCADLF